MTQNPNPDPNSDQTLNFASKIEAEETLRLIAQLPAPESLIDRIHARVRHQMAVENTTPARRGFWSLWSPGQRLQFAGAAALVLAFAGSMWTINHTHPAGAPTSSVPQAITPSQATPNSGFVGAKASRQPATLNPIKVPPAPKKKPSPKGLAKPSPVTKASTITRAVAAQSDPSPNR
jgi:hypothetical protein